MSTPAPPASKGGAAGQGEDDSAGAPTPPPQKPLRARPSSRRPSPAFTRAAAELRQHVERLGTDRVAAILRLNLADLGPLLAGRVSASPKLVRKLREAASAATGEDTYL